MVRDLKWNSRRVVLVGTLVATIVLALLSTSSRSRNVENIGPSYTKSRWYKGSRRWDIGPLRAAKLLMENTQHYRVETDRDWKQLVPPDGGIIRMENDDRPYTISLFHQLRCLDVIRDTVLQANRNGTLPDRKAQHCLNFLRQMVLCRADTYLESAYSLTAKHTVEITTPKTCHDWTQVYDSAERNREYFDPTRRTRS